MRRRYIVILGFSILIATGLPHRQAVVAQRPPPGGAVQDSNGPSGRTTTRLPDGRLLLVGGQGPRGAVVTAWLSDPATQALTVLAAGMNQARAWHTATLLADGTVLVLGGRSAGALAEVPEIFNPGPATSR